jgi:putative colanic acid biosynthesis acetyltransferase WcaF
MEIKTDLSKFDNKWYDTRASVLKLVLWQIFSALFFINHLSGFSGLKVAILRMFGARIGKGVVIKQSVRIKNPWLLHIGDHVWIGECSWIENHALVKIGNNCCISQGAMLLCGNHNFKKSTFDLIVGEIHLEEGVWIGARSTVCPGITCHSHSVLTVNSVASTNLEAYTVYRGNPAVKQRERIMQI